MAINGPFVPSDLDVTGIIDGLRVQSTWTTKSSNFTMGTREAEGFIITGVANVTVTAPAANDTDLKVGSKFYIVNDTTATTTVSASSSGTIGTIGAGLSALLVLKTNADANGTWELIQFDKDDNTGITKFSASFNGDIAPTAGASWTVATAGVHTFTVTKATHMKGDNPIVTVYNSLGDEPLMKITRVASGASIGNVILTVSAVPSGVFAGTVIII